MKHFRFYDVDYFTNSGEYIITDDHFQMLMQICFKHSAYLLLGEDNGTHLTQELSLWRVPNPPFEIDYSHPWQLFEVNSDVLAILLSHKDNLFLIRYPVAPSSLGDTIFYRKDGSEFFYSIHHEGECGLYPRENEDVQDVLRFAHWLPFDTLEQPVIPACNVRLLPASREEIYADHLFKQLQAIKNHNAHDIYTIESLCHYLRNYRHPRIPAFFADKTDPNGSLLPSWFLSFRFFLLGKCDAMTNTTIQDALKQFGTTGTLGFYKFFEFLDEFIEK